MQFSVAQEEAIALVADGSAPARGSSSSVWCLLRRPRSDCQPFDGVNSVAHSVEDSRALGGASCGPAEVSAGLALADHDVGIRRRRSEEQDVVGVVGSPLVIGVAKSQVEHLADASQRGSG